MIAGKDALEQEGNFTGLVDEDPAQRDWGYGGRVIADVEIPDSSLVFCVDDRCQKGKALAALGIDLGNPNQALAFP